LFVGLVLAIALLVGLLTKPIDLTPQCHVDQVDTMAEWYRDSVGGVSFYHRMLRSNCYMVTMMLVPSYKPTGYPGYGAMYEAFVFITGKGHAMYAGTEQYQIVSYENFATCQEAMERAGKFLDEMHQLGMFTPPHSSYDSKLQC
jgi:hypothetical protein